jgi:peroxiredoxin
VAALPHTEELHQKFKDRGLVVIGVHSVRDSDQLAEFLKAKKVTFPVMIDRGETAERYAVDAWPRYFLIDRAGTVRWSHIEGNNSERRDNSEILAAIKLLS